MGEAAAAVDLSAGALPADDQARINRLEEQRHRFSLQRTVANSVPTVAVAYFIVAAMFGLGLLYAIVVQDRSDVHWHASLLVAGFVIPPTLMIIALVRAAYDSKQKESDSGPALSFLKECVGVVSAAFKKPGTH